jgi:predicted transcriptional regulator
MRTSQHYLNNKEIDGNKMGRRLTLPQLKKYDITQRVIEALADAESRTIVFSIIKKGRTAAEIAEKYKIPLSSVYKKLTDLEELTLVEVERWLISDKGRRFKVYRSRISKADISIKKPEPMLNLAPN